MKFAQCRIKPKQEDMNKVLLLGRDLRKTIESGPLCITDFFQNKSVVGFPAGPFRPGKSREGPGTGRDRTGPRDLAGPVVLWSRA